MGLSDALDQVAESLVDAFGVEEEAKSEDHVRVVVLAPVLRFRRERSFAQRVSCLFLEKTGAREPQSWRRLFALSLERRRVKKARARGGRAAGRMAAHAALEGVCRRCADCRLSICATTTAMARNSASAACSRVVETVSDFEDDLESSNESLGSRGSSEHSPRRFSRNERRNRRASRLAAQHATFGVAVTLLDALDLRGHQRQRALLPPESSARTLSLSLSPQDTKSCAGLVRREETCADVDVVARALALGLEAGDLAGPATHLPPTTVTRKGSSPTWTMESSNDLHAPCGLQNTQRSSRATTPVYTHSQTPNGRILNREPCRWTLPRTAESVLAEFAALLQSKAAHRCMKRSCAARPSARHAAKDACAFSSDDLPLAMATT